MEGIGMKVKAIQFAQVWGELSKWQTKPLKELSDLIYGELETRRVERYRAPRIDDPAPPLVGQPSGDADAT
jgi:hypothetical protein